MRCVPARAVTWWGSVAAVSAACVVVAATTATATPAMPGTDSQVHGNPMAAVWKERHLDFLYLGRTVRYSCEGLRDKVRAMLLDLGARRDVKITATGCDDYDRIRADSVSPRLDIFFSAPALPSVAAKPLHTGDLAAVDARFEPFTITNDAFRNMGIGDCELVEEFARQILPKLATRDVKQDITCVPYQQSGSRFLVRGEILKTLPPPERSALGQK